MGTFVIFFVIFSIFALFLWISYTHMNNSYGDNSPLKVQRSYTTTELAYFTKFDNWFFYALAIFTVMFLRLLVSPPTGSNSIETVIAIVIVSAIFGTLSFFALKLDYRYWRKTRATALHFFPESKSIVVELPHRQFTLNENNIERIEETTNNGKLVFSYRTYYLKNGESFLLTDRLGGQWAITEYFKQVPLIVINKAFPPKL